MLTEEMRHMLGVTWHIILSLIMADQMGILA